MVGSPLVSIVTPVLNRVEYTSECIENILKQTYPNIEHIFVDGGSTDGTVEVLCNYQRLYPERIRYISEPDRGIGDAANKGWAMASGGILGWIDVGDWYELDAVQSVVEAFEKNPTVDVVYGGGRMFDHDGKFLRNYITEDFNWKKTRDNTNQMHTPPAAFYKACVIKGIFGKYPYQVKFPDSGDNLEIHLFVGSAFKVQRIDKQIFNIRLQKDSVTFANIKMVRGVYRLGYELCRKYGGGIFAPRCRRYYLFTMLDKLHLYNFVALGLVKNIRRWSLANKVLGKLGLLTN